jgi:acetyl-CoA carboxylase/biotin carboxylase 1
MSLLKSYEGGRESHAHFVVKSLFEEYLAVEELFSDGIQVILHTQTEHISTKKSKKMLTPFHSPSLEHILTNDILS